MRNMNVVLGILGIAFACGVTACSAGQGSPTDIGPAYGDRPGVGAADKPGQGGTTDPSPTFGPAGGGGQNAGGRGGNGGGNGNANGNGNGGADGGRSDSGAVSMTPPATGGGALGPECTAFLACCAEAVKGTPSAAAACDAQKQSIDAAQKAGASATAQLEGACKSAVDQYKAANICK